MVTCAQCPRPALYWTGDANSSPPLCLHCYAVFDEICSRKFLFSAAMLNQANDDLGSFSSALSSPNRIPVAELANAMNKNNIRNNINVANSNIGMISTGDFSKINATIDVSMGSEREEFGARLKDAVEIIINNKDVDDKLKRDLVGILRAIADESYRDEPNSKVITALFDGLFSYVEKFAGITSAVEKLLDAWQRYLGG